MPYTPAPFSCDDRGVALQTIAEAPLATLLTLRNGEAVVSHLPFVVVESDERLVLAAHLARANPQAQVLEGPATAIFTGPNGYISPRWYAGCDQNVPTWNYIVVHAAGTIRLASAEQMRDILSTLTDTMEGERADAWRTADMERGYAQRLEAAITGFYLDVDDLAIVTKLSQNRCDEDFNSVVHGLEHTGSAGDRRLAEVMRARRH